ncbi:hypothetical protein EVC45_20260 [Paraburkholderia sp. UYCP14C]|uniref:hypothetical protein n=1 Tax=Paraburkholderia sp. UYCP14C TaxID=2511130 RepID=UPI00102155AA|nr:hypothetical protein [Paraburkholderia sp. UYCP14C]RZF27824.1 hypothetical protein EVC45_20260 [Paraburkholderia sp. UYCP14C]
MPDVDGSRHHAISMPVRVPAGQAGVHSRANTALSELRRAMALARVARRKRPRGVAKTKQSVPSRFADPIALSRLGRLAHQPILLPFPFHGVKKKLTM